jgi:hypothetical protein
MSIDKTRIDLKDIDIDYKRETAHRDLFITFTDVFDSVSMNFFSESNPIFRPGPQISLMVYERVPCDCTKV